MESRDYRLRDIDQARAKTADREARATSNQKTRVRVELSWRTGCKIDEARSGKEKYLCRNQSGEGLCRELT